MTKIERKMHTIDAEGQAPGRLATEIARLLIGKHKPSYVPNIDCGDAVTVENAGKMKITGSKMTGKIYYRHSGHPGGLKQEQLKQVFEKDPAEVLRRAVKRMLPNNKLRTGRMLRLQVK